MSVTFDDAALFDLHDGIDLLTGPVTGNWQPDARQVSPLNRAAGAGCLNGGEGGLRMRSTRACGGMPGTTTSLQFPRPASSWAHAPASELPPTPRPSDLPWLSQPRR
jgi:hypothetical protein